MNKLDDTHEMELVPDFFLGTEVVPSATTVHIINRHHVGGQVFLQVQTPGVNSIAIWFSAQDRLPLNGRQYLVLRYPPGTYADAEVEPLLVASIENDSCLRTVTADEFDKVQKLWSQKTHSRNNHNLNVSELGDMLGSITELK